MKDNRCYMQEVRNRIMKDLEFGEELSDGQMKDLISRHLMEYQSIGHLSLRDRTRMGKEIFYSLRKLDVLQELMEDDSVTEIMVNGKDHVFVEREGRISRTPLSFESEEKLLQVIQQIVSGCNRAVNEASPIVDARLPGGARVNVVLSPIALNGPILTIRRFSDQPMTMER